MAIGDRRLRDLNVAITLAAVVSAAVAPLPLAMAASDWVLVHALYGRRAIVEGDLQIINHNPPTVSNGDRVPHSAAFLAWVGAVVTWGAFGFVLCRLAAR